MRIAALVCLAIFVVDAVLVGARVGWLVDADASVSHRAAQAVHTHSWLLRTARVITQFGNPIVVNVAIAVLVVGLLVRRQRVAAGAVLLARLAALGTQAAVKALVDRPRPMPDSPVAFAAGSSFPSGHSNGAATVATVAAILVAVEARRRWVVVASVAALAVVAVAVAASRVLLLVHYPSDVLGGLLLGAGVAGLSLAPVVRPTVGEADPEPRRPRSNPRR